jgi:hypothetical protein
MNDKNKVVHYFCANCDFITNNRYNYEKHNNTEKHKNKINPSLNDCDNCGKKYKYKSGLSRHKLTCGANKVSLLTNNTSNLNTDTQNTMIKIIADTLSRQGDIIEKLVNAQKDMIPKLGNNNNNKISINVYLNKHCKNAMNLTDFINSIKISLEDLEYTNAHGYVKGVSNIFKKNLTYMKATERPIHCSDKKRLQFYIKDENKWDRDDLNIHIDKGIRSVTQKALYELRKWEKNHPNYDKVNTQDNLEWLMMIQKLSSGYTKKNKEKNMENIKKNISCLIGLRDAIVES